MRSLPHSWRKAVHSGEAPTANTNQATVSMERCRSGSLWPQLAQRAVPGLSCPRDLKVEEQPDPEPGRALQAAETAGAKARGEHKPGTCEDQEGGQWGWSQERGREVAQGWRSRCGCSLVRRLILIPIHVIKFIFI